MYFSDRVYDYIKLLDEKDQSRVLIRVLELVFDEDDSDMFITGKEKRMEDTLVLILSEIMKEETENFLSLWK